MLEFSEQARGLDDYYKNAMAMLNSPRVREAFDLSKEPSWLRERYGRTTYGQGCLLARRQPRRRRTDQRARRALAGTTVRCAHLAPITILVATVAVVLLALGHLGPLARLLGHLGPLHAAQREPAQRPTPVSYTHLTLPTKA